MNRPNKSPDDAIIQKNVGDNIRKYRLAKHLSQEQLAQRARMTKNYVADTENGLRNISLNNVGRIAAALDVHVSRLFVSPNAKAADNDEPNEE